jgi:hypothetical protein
MIEFLTMSSQTLRNNGTSATSSRKKKASKVEKTVYVREVRLS